MTLDTRADGAAGARKAAAVLGLALCAETSTATMSEDGRKVDLKVSSCHAHKNLNVRQIKSGDSYRATSSAAARKPVVRYGRAIAVVKDYPTVENMGWTDMTKLWRVVAVGMLGVAALQFLGLAQYAVHGIFLTYKWGYESPILPAGTEALRVFLFVSGAAAGAGAVAWTRLRNVSPNFARCARIATLSLLAGAAGCLAMIASPFVDLVRR